MHKLSKTLLNCVRWTPAIYEPLAQMAGSYWTIEETKALLGIWSAANVQAQLNVVSRKKVVYERVATALVELGYEHTWEQCKNKRR